MIKHTVVKVPVLHINYNRVGQYGEYKEYSRQIVNQFIYIKNQKFVAHYITGYREVKFVDQQWQMLNYSTHHQNNPGETLKRILGQ